MRLKETKAIEGQGAERLWEGRQLVHVKRVRQILLKVTPGNTARSLLAEAILNHAGRGRFRAASAETLPTGPVHPLVPATLRTLRLPVDGLRSKPWQEVAVAGVPVFDLVFPLCDKRTGERCPVWPGLLVSGVGGIATPATPAGSLAQQPARFLQVAQGLRRRIEIVLALPPAALDALSLRRAAGHMKVRLAA